jgi:hypothetical protein
MSLLGLSKKDVDGRDEPGHDEKGLMFQVVRKRSPTLNAF